MMLHSVSSISTTMESSSLRLPPEEVTTQSYSGKGGKVNSARAVGRNCYFANEFRRNLTRERGSRTDSRQRPSIRPGNFCDRPCFQRTRRRQRQLPTVQYLLLSFSSRFGSGTSRLSR